MIAKDLLIADFMGVGIVNEGELWIKESFLPPDSAIIECCLPSQSMYLNNTRYINCSAFFKSSWDWLMPVIEKCENLSNDNDLTMGDITHRLLDYNIEGTFDEVVKFIIKYNNINN